MTRNDSANNFLARLSRKASMGGSIISAGVNTNMVSGLMARIVRKCSMPEPSRVPLGKSSMDAVSRIQGACLPRRGRRATIVTYRYGLHIAGLIGQLEKLMSRRENIYTGVLDLRMRFNILTCSLLRLPPTPRFWNGGSNGSCAAYEAPNTTKRASC